MAYKPKPPQFGSSATGADQAALAFQKQQIDFEKAKYEKMRAECINKGGTWDDVSKTCNLPLAPQKDPYQIDTPQPAGVQNQPTPPPQAGEIITDAETGQPKGFVNSAGEVVLTDNRADLQAVADTRANDIAPIAGGQDYTARLETLRKQQVLAQLGQVTGVSQAELQGLIKKYGLDPASQFKEGAAGALYNAIPSALQTGVTAGIGAAVIGGAGAGAGIGAVGGPWGIAAGATAGVVFGLWRGLMQGQKAEAKEDVGNAMAEFGQLRKGMAQVATMAGSGMINEYEAVELYNAQLSRMLQIEAEIKYLQDSNLKDYLSDGSDDLATISTYLNEVAPAYKLRIQTGIANPSSKIPYSDIVLEDLQS